MSDGKHYRIEPIWKQVTPELGEEILAFWRANKAIANEAAAAARVQQAVCVARDDDGAIQGVGTAIVKVLPRLRQPMYYYRQYFSRQMRGRNQIRPFYLAARDILQAHNASLEKPESLGLLIELENGKLASAYSHAYEKAFDSTFIGYSPRGLTLRVTYFEGARLMPPAPIRGPSLAVRNARPNPARKPVPRRNSDRS